LAHFLLGHNSIRSAAKIFLKTLARVRGVCYNEVTNQERGTTMNDYIILIDGTYTDQVDYDTACAEIGLEIDPNGSAPEGTEWVRDMGDYEVTVRKGW